MPSRFAAGTIGQLGEPNSFAGFALPTSSTTYTPNQFFDVCLPHASRGCVRAVGFLIRKTLGWCDEHGNPTESQFRLSYNQFERYAGIGHSSIKAALDEAIARSLVIREGESRASVAGHSAESSMFELCWDARPHYAKHPDLFGGFYEGEANVYKLLMQHRPGEEHRVLHVVSNLSKLRGLRNRVVRMLEEYGVPRAETEIRTCGWLAQVDEHGGSIWHWRPTCKGAQDVGRLIDEALQRLGFEPEPITQKADAPLATATALSITEHQHDPSA